MQRNSQFIISTHSPLLMSYPESVIYQLTSRGIEEVTLEETDHYELTRRFLNNRQRMLQELFREEDGE
ncbi:putative ATPase [Paenibacillus mucilaginosus]